MKRYSGYFLLLLFFVVSIGSSGARVAKNLFHAKQNGQDTHFSKSLTSNVFSFIADENDLDDDLDGDSGEDESSEVGLFQISFNQNVIASFSLEVFPKQNLFGSYSRRLFLSIPIYSSVCNFRI